MWTALVVALAAIGLCWASETGSRAPWEQAAALYGAETSKADNVFNESFDILKRTAAPIFKWAKMDEVLSFFGHSVLPEVPGLRSDSIKLPLLHSGPHITYEEFTVKRKILKRLAQVAPGSAHVSEGDITLGDAETLLRAALACRRELNKASVAAETAAADIAMDSAVLFALSTTFMYRTEWFGCETRATAWLKRARMIVDEMSSRVVLFREHARMQALLTQDCAYWSELFHVAVRMLSTAGHDAKTAQSNAAQSALPPGTSAADQMTHLNRLEPRLSPNTCRLSAVESLRSRFAAHVALLDALRDYELNMVWLQRLVVHAACAKAAYAVLASPIPATQSPLVREYRPAMLEKVSNMRKTYKNSINCTLAKFHLLEPQLKAAINASIKADRLAKDVFDAHSALPSDPRYTWSSFVRILGPLYNFLPAETSAQNNTATPPGKNSRVVEMEKSSNNQVRDVVRAVGALFTVKSEDAFLQSLERVFVTAALYRDEFSEYAATRMGAYTGYYVATQSSVTQTE